MKSPYYPSLLFGNLVFIKGKKPCYIVMYLGQVIDLILMLIPKLK